MPTYEYQCDHCHRTFEFPQRMADKPLTECPMCNASGVRRIPSLPSVITRSKTSPTSKSPSAGIGLNCAVDPNFRAPSLGVRMARVR
ncbi:MAG: zinc ribbon domain-containing protein [Verrucomicrobiota bacterium]